MRDGVFYRRIGAPKANFESAPGGFEVRIGDRGDLECLACGESEMVEMDAPQNYAVPVSRSRIGRLKSRVAALGGGDPGIGLRRRHHFASQ